MMNVAESIVVVAHWHVQPTSLQKVLALTEEVQRRSLEEPGCEGYEVFRGLAQAHHLVLVERYASEAAVEAHRASQHYRDIVQGQIIPLLESRRVELLRPRSAD